MNEFEKVDEAATTTNKHKNNPIPSQSSQTGGNRKTLQTVKIVSRNKPLNWDDSG